MNSRITMLLVELPFLTDLLCRQTPSALMCKSNLQKLNRRLMTLLSGFSNVNVTLLIFKCL